MKPLAEKKKSGWKQKLTALLFSGLLVVALLGFGEFYCRRFTRVNFLDNSRGLFVGDRYGTSYGNTPDFEGVSFGETFYTDENGFRIDPQFNSVGLPGDAPALLIIGDSVTFGPAVREEATIAGRLRRLISDARVYNASVIGYDVFDYKNAVGAIIERKPEIKTVLLFYCLNDVNNVSAQQIRQQTAAPEASENLSLSRAANEYLRSRSKLYIWSKNALRDTSLLYFQNDLSAYQKGDEYVQKGLQPLSDLKRRLDASGITLKIFVLPYEAQTRPGSPPKFFLPQKIVTDFLRRNEIAHTDATADFQKAGAAARELFLYGDPMHLSEEGNRLVAEIVRAELKNRK